MEYGKKQKFTVYGTTSTTPDNYSVLILDMSLHVNTAIHALAVAKTLDFLEYYDGEYNNVYKHQLEKDMYAHDVEILRHMHAYCTLPDDSLKVEVRLIIQAKPGVDILKKEVVGEIIHRFCKNVFDDYSLPFRACSADYALDNFIKGEW